MARGYIIILLCKTRLKKGLRKSMEHKQRVIGYFREKFSAVSMIDEQVDPSSTFRRLLYISLIDALSRLIYPVKNKNRERFTSFVKNFADWDDSNRMSLTHLHRFLALNPEPEYEKVRQYVKATINKWIPGDVITINSEPTFETIQKMWPRDNKWQQEIKFESFQHLQLLYELRNNLVHQFRVLGNTAYNDFEKTPYYMHTTTLIGIVPETFTETWELLYPLSFLSKLVEKAINNVEKYLDKNEFDYSSFLSDDTYWIDEIN